MENFSLFANCIPVRGYYRACIYDLQKNDYLLIPISLFDIIKERSFNLSELLNRYKDYSNVIHEYIDVLKTNNYVFKEHEENLYAYPCLDLTFDYPAKISNAIIYSHCFDINILKPVNTRYFTIVFNEVISEDTFFDIISKYISSFIHSLDIYIVEGNRIDYIKLMNSFLKVKTITIFKSKENKKIWSNDIPQSIFTIKNDVVDALGCGEVHYGYFSINYEHFFESINHNTCLNRKLCIDENGEIKNCPAMERSFGNIKDTTLEEAINKPGFKDLWDIKKDDIDVCKDCEFRYMCTDCRAFIKDPNNIYSQPAKCTYNPYIALWKGQDGWISVEEWRAANPDWEKDAVRMIPGKDYYVNDN